MIVTPSRGAQRCRNKFLLSAMSRVGGASQRHPATPNTTAAFRRLLRWSTPLINSGLRAWPGPLLATGGAVDKPPPPAAKEDHTGRSREQVKEVPRPRPAPEGPGRAGCQKSGGRHPRVAAAAGFPKRTGPGRESKPQKSRSVSVLSGGFAVKPPSRGENARLSRPPRGPEPRIPRAAAAGSGTKFRRARRAGTSA